ncbi:hypothetical protein N9B82_00745 [Saprospiraceae bacterium]|nr:hypothetical protein [Saprospiraceae bacterium]
MKFSEVVGTETVKNTLRSLVDDDIMPHAMILSGPAGNSKLPLALAYVAYLMCEDRQGSEACGACRSCSKTFKHIHPDVHFSFPFIGSTAIADEFIKPWRKFLGKKPYGSISAWLTAIEADNKQANINTKECRSIIKKLNLQSFESEKKVLIMWLPEFLRKDGNRLLKLIEEPTPNTYFILVTDKPQEILPTIISRCQHIKVPPLLDDEISSALVSHYFQSEEKATALAFVAEGNMSKALEMMEHGASNLHDEILTWFRICYSSKAVSFVDWVDSFAKKSKDEQKGFLLYALNLFREIARVNILPENQLRIQQSEIQTAKKIAGIINFEKIEKLNNILTDTIYYIERNANIKVLMMETNISFKNVLRQGR